MKITDLKDQVVHCATKEEALRVLKLADEAKSAAQASFVNGQ